MRRPTLRQVAGGAFALACTACLGALPFVPLPEPVAIILLALAVGGIIVGLAEAWPEDRNARG